jgi:hypothetical protein
MPLNDYFPQRSYGAVMHKGRQLSSRARSFLEILDGGFAGRMPAPSRGHGALSAAADDELVAPLTSLDERN